MQEHSAGAMLVRGRGKDAAVLLIRMRPIPFEVPKGHLESGESAEEAAVRELREETGFAGECTLGPFLGTLEYTFTRGGRTTSKRVDYFVAIAKTLDMERMPPRTRERRWVTAVELEKLPLVAETLRPLLQEALQWVRESDGGQDDN